MKNDEKQSKTKDPKILQGVVVSDKMDKTVIVAVNRFYKHPKYKKYVKTTKRYKVHDEENACKVGQKVTIEEVRPMSKDKHFKILSKA